MKITKLLLCTWIVSLVAAAQIGWAATITNCAEVTQASPTDVDSTPGNFATAPSEDDGACAVLTLLEDYDLGDAPDPTYPTTLADDGARHLQTGNTLYLGSCVDTDADGQQNSAATGDDTGVSTLGTIGTCTNNDDEDGVIFNDPLQAGAQNVTVTVTANASCKLNAWIDWNGNGSWGDVGDQIATDQQLGAGSNTLTLNVPSSATPGGTYARFRCSTAGGDGVTGEAADGEVEDYRVTIAAAVPKIDLKKYVQDASGAPAYNSANEAGTLGTDAQEFVSGVILPYGHDALYRIRVENTGATRLGSVTVDDQIDGCDPLTKVYDSDGTSTGLTMNKGEVWVLECTLPALKQDIVNIAKVRATPINDDGTETGQSPVDDFDPANVIIPQERPAISLKKYVRLNGAAQSTEVDAQDAGSALLVNAGDAVTYRIVVMNTGNTWLSDVVMDDRLAGCSPVRTDSNTSDALLAPAETWTYECTGVVTNADTYNLATVTANPANPDGTSTGQSPVNSDDPANVRIRVNQPAIHLKKYVVSGGSDYDAQDANTAVLINSGATVNYKIVVTNPGNTTLGSVVVDDQLENCLLSAPSGDTNNNNRLETTETWTYTCSLTNVKVDTYNLATVTATPVNNDGTPTGQSPVNDEDPANVRVRVNQPAIQLKKYVVAGGIDNDAQDAGKAVLITAGSTVNYKIVVTNIGNTVLGSVNVDDQLEDCTLGAVTGDIGNDGLMQLNEEWTYTCSTPNVRVDTQNYATVSATPVNSDGSPTGQSPVNDGDPANVRIQLGQPAIELKKYVRPVAATAGSAQELDAEDMSSALVVTHGSTVTYRMVVRNTGNTPLINVNLDEHMAGCVVSQTVGAGDTVLDPGEYWEYECTKSDMTSDQENIADVQAQPANPDGTPTTQSPVRDLDPANVRIPTADPSISLKKYVVANGSDNDAQDAGSAVLIASGSTVTYKIVATNTGSATLGNVQVDDQLTGCNLGSAVGDTGNDGRMGIGEIWTYTCSVAGITVDTYNLATVTATPVNPDDGTPTGQSPVTSEDPANVRIPDTQPGIQLKKYVTVGSTNYDAQDMATAVVIDSGADVKYTIIATNTGNTPLANVNVDDRLDGCTLSAAQGDTNANDRLDLTETWTYTCQVSAVQTDLYNLATVEALPVHDDGTPTGQSPVNDNDPANVKIRVERPAIELKKYVVDGATDADAQDYSTAVLINSGSNVTYKIVVSNPGNAPLADVTVDDQLAGCTLSGPASGNDANSNDLLDTGETWTYTCTVSNVTTDLYNLATVEAKPANPDGTLTTQSPVTAEDPANVRIPLGQPAIQLKKYVVSGGDNDAQDAGTAVLVDAGSTVTYKIVVTNIGNTGLGSVQVDDQLAGCTLNPPQGDTGNDGRMAVGEVWTYTCDVADVRVDTYNYANVTATPINSSDGTPTGQSPVTDGDPANVRIPLSQPAIQLKKYVRLTGSAVATELDAEDMSSALIVDQGASVTYRMVVTNIGNTPLVSVVLDEHMAGCNVSQTVGGGQSIFNPGDAWEYECTKSGMAADQENIAAVQAQPANPDGTPTTQSPVRDLDPANVKIRVERPAIELKKYVVDGATDADAQDYSTAVLINSGSNVTYKIVVSNPGNAPLADVTVDDQLAGCTLSGPASGNDANSNNLLDTGETWTYTCTVSNVTTDLYNLATVEAKPANPDGTLTTQSPVTAEDPANVRIPLGQPAIQLKKYVVSGGDNDAQDAGTAVLVDAGSTVTYKIVVTNIGNTGLGSVQVDDQLAGCTLNPPQGDTGNDGRMAVGEVWTYTCDVADVRVDTYNYANVTATPINSSDGTPTGQSPVTDGDPANVRIPLSQPAIQLKKYVRLTGSAVATELDAEDMSSALIVDQGVSVTYRMVVTNIGNTPLVSVVLDEHMAGCNVSQTVGGGQSIFNPGDAWEYECTKSGMAADQENIAAVQAQPANPDGTPTTQSPVRDLDPANVKIRVERPAIELKKYVVDGATDADAQDYSTAVLINSGSNVTYKIVVSNPGNAPLADVTVDDQLAGCTLSGPASGNDANSNDLLDTGETWTYTCTVSNVTTDLYNLATVEAKPANPDGTLTTQSPVTAEDPANVRIRLGQPAIELKKYVQDAATAPAFNASIPLAGLGNDAQDMSAASMLKNGSNALYRMVVTNIGNAPLAQVVLTEHLDGCAVSRLYNGDADAMNLLIPGEYWVYQCTKSNVTVDMQNVASVEAKPANTDGTLTTQSPVDDEDPANIRIGEGLPSIQLKKYVRLSTASGQGNDAQDSLYALLVKHGDNVIYRIEVKNTGSTALSGVTVEDHLPGCNLPTTPMSGDNGTTSLMDVGETWVYECTQNNVTEDVYNMATVSAIPAYENGTVTGQSPVSDEDPANVRIPLAEPAIELKKYVRLSGTMAPGNDAQDALHALLVPYDSTVTYRIEVRNTGSTTLANIDVEDSLPGCNLPTNPVGDDGDNLLQVGELWSYECTQNNVTTDVYNLGTVVAQPVHDDGTPTNQSPVMAQDPANVRIPVQQPAVELKKYVRLEGTAAPGNDAQDNLSALLVKHGDNVVYRITVRNTGNTVLNNVKVDDKLEGCSLPANPQSGDNGNGMLDPGELWVYECSQANVATDVYNLATVVATPANSDGTPTGQSPITADDPANIRIPSTEPAIQLKKYVRLEGTAPATGLDAQDSSTALRVNDNSNVTYRIVVRNVGSTALANVDVQDHLDNCTLTPVDMGDMDAANILKQGETWIFECTKTGIRLDTYNLATVEARPVHDDGTPTGQSPVDAEDPANVLVRKTLPSISLKKYVRPQGGTAPGNDAQDALHALTVNYGSNVTYRIEVRNTGSAPLINVKVEDHLDGCNLPANPSSGDTGNDAILGLDEVWVYECDQTNVTTDVYNLATVEAVPANADGTPTNQSPVDAEDPANVHIQVNGPSITLKKYVQPATGALAFDPNNIATLGVDAQDTIHAQQLEFGNAALFRVVVKNTGTTWLDTLGIEDHLETCNPFNRIYTSVDNNDTLSPGEYWVYECTVPDVTQNLANLATVEARPIQQDGTPTGQSPVDSHDMANVMIPVREPAIELKKYVRKVGEAAPGIDAQDTLHALTIAHGDSVVYNISVRNVGDTVLGNVSVDDRLDGCVLNPVSLADGDNLLGIGEVWTYECTQNNVTEDVYNLATVTARPVYADGTPTGQSPVNANDPANVRIPLDSPSISLKKYVQDNATAPAYVAGDITTMGVDAQDATVAAYIPYDGTALYRIAVQNTGNTWLDQVAVDDSLENCALTRIDRGDADIDDTLKPGETWVYECTLGKVDTDIRNLATVTARPVHADLAPTGQSPVTASDPAHVTTELAPKIAIRKYVQNANGAPAYWFGDDRTLGYDAEDATAAVYIPYDGTALYRITVTNTGNTWLDQVVVDDQLDNCSLSNIDKGDGDDSLKPAERWVYECTLANIRDKLRNTATVEARPINPDGTSTSQSPVDDSNVAHVTTELAPKIALRKYAQDANGAPAYDATDDATLGQDAEDVGAAAYIPYDGTALYRITVTNTGNTWLDKVVVDDQMTGCDLKNIDQGDGDGTLRPEERWVYECTQANVIEDIRNTATVEARPINPDGSPTNQSPVDDSNVAHVTTELAPKVAIRKYVQDANGALAYDATDDATLGQDAEDAVSATYIPYDGTALYRITVTNTGNTWLDKIIVDDQMAGCDLKNIDQGDGDSTLRPEERWVYECSLANVNEDVRNTATVEARPVNPDGTPTNQSPVDDSNVADITTEPAPEIALKKYVQDASSAMPYDASDDLSLGADAQDAVSATFIPYDGTALYRITVTNTGNTWLNKVVVDDQMAGCDLQSIDNGDGDDMLRPDERWVYECSLAKVNENVRNTATVEAHSINPDGTPTNQAPVDASDVANITTEPAPQITLKTYVQDNGKAPAYDPADLLTLGLDAQDASTAAYIPYDGTALYRIVVTNTGNTWLDNVVMDPNLASCPNPVIIDKGDGDDSLRPTEFWVYECSMVKVNENVSNTATVTAHPVNPDGTPSNQSPVNASDPANITTEPAPAILLKKYAQAADTARPYDAADDTTLGIDAQDETGAAYIMYDASALYYITVTNTGNTWLKDITVDDKLEGCDAQIIDQGDGDAYLRPQERWVYTCQISNVKQPLTNLATVQAYAINPDLTPTNQAPVSSEDVANIRTHKGHSLGNYVWIDNGNGITANYNNGQVDANEKPAPDGVVLELNDASGNPVNLGNGALTTMTSSGYYLFSALPPGEYQVCVAASNFTRTGPLFGYGVSTVNESDPNADKDQNNNGMAPADGKVCSGIITLDDNEPVKEFPTASGQAGNDAAGSEDTASNLTIDFGFVPVEVGVGNRLWIDEGVSIETTNNGIYDEGEAPLADILVEVYGQGQDPDVDTPISTTTTDRFGCYSFEHLTAGTYFVHVPYYQSVLDGTLEVKPLYAYVSSKGDDGDTGIDDDKGENGIDELATMELSGIKTSLFTLIPGQEPTGERQCGKTVAPAILDDANYDGTKDIGVLRYMQLGNYVWFDRNANGIQDANEAGIADATVELFAADGVTPVIDIHGNPVEAVKTDAQGKYLFTSLVPGKYVVRVTPPEADYMVTPKAVADPNTDDNTDSNALAVEGQPYAQSGVVELSYNGEPMHDGDLENPNSNLTIDFGFYIPVAVGDRVWLDHNGNGQQEAEDLNISGATVSLFAADGVTPVIDAEGNTVADQTTGSDGLYLFDKLLEGDYVVKVKAPSEVYLPTKGGSDPDDDNNTDSNALPLVDGVSSSLPVTLQVRSEPLDDGDGAHPRNSSTNSTVDFGFIRPLAIGDFIWGDNNADGIQTEGETGLAGSEVTLLTTAGNPVIDLKGETVAPVTVDETGAYHFEMLMEGDYIVRVVPPEGFIASKPLQGNNIVTDSNCMATDTVGLFQTPDMTLRFNQQPETSVDGDNSDRDMTEDCGFFHPVGVGNYIWMDVNGDGLQGSGEKGLAEAKVELLGADGVTSVTDVNDQPVLAQTTGTDGKYGFDDLKPGDYIVQVTPPEGFRVTGGGADPDEDPSNLDNNCVAVGETFQTKPVTLFGLTEPATELDGDDTSHNSTVDCGFFRTATLGGRLWIDVDMDGKQTEGEPDLSDMQLILTDANGQPVKDIFGEDVQPIKSAANGEYAFTNLVAGQYIVLAQIPPAYRPTTGVADPNNDDDTDSNGFYDKLNGYIASGVVDLSWDSEPVSEDGDPSTNLTIDFGFIPQVAIPTVSEWGLIIMSLMLMLAGVYWQRRRYMK